MVRNIVGCLVDVGTGKLKPRQVKDILEEQSDVCATHHQQAPAYGLYLVNVYYDKNKLTSLQRSQYAKLTGSPS
jgi:tRNA pseudouridine38-40 synthase